MKKLFMVGNCLVLSALLAAAEIRAAIETKEPAAAAQFRQLERDIPSLYLMNGLCLSQDQAARLAELLDKAQALEAGFEKRAGRIMRTHEKELAARQAEVERWAARGVDATERNEARTPPDGRLGRARQEMGKLRQEFNCDMDQFADKAYALLTDSQRAIVDKFTPCFIPPQDFRSPERVGQAAADTSFVEEVLTRLRRAPEQSAHESPAFDRALEALVPYTMDKRHVRYTEEAAAKTRKEIGSRLKTELHGVRTISDADFELEKARIAARVVPLKDAAAQGDPGARRWKIRHYLLNVGILDVVQERAGKTKRSGSVGTASVSKRDMAAPAASLRRTLETADLIGRLDLTEDQARKMLPIVKGALTKREEVEKEMGKAMSDGIGPYQELRRELAAGQPSGSGESQAGRWHGAVKTLRDETMVHELLDCERQLDSILTAGQVAFLSSRDTEEAPPPGESGCRPDRRVEKSLNAALLTLSDARRMSAIVFAKEKEDLCRAFVKNCLERSGADSGNIDVEAEVKRGIALLECVRALDSKAYSSQREDLAAELCPRLSGPRPMVYGTRYRHGQPVEMLGRSTDLVFSDPARNILAKMAGER